jgi:ribosomal protein S19
MVKVSIEVHDGTAWFMVAIKAQSIQQALSTVATRHPSSVTKVKFPIDPESFFVEDSAA